jgi:NAD(P)H dehydrogenase (quinone)
MAEVLGGVEASIAKGELAVTTGDLSRLIGRPATPLADAVRAALQG